jgi:hypothetical protein
MSCFHILLCLRPTLPKPFQRRFSVQPFLFWNKAGRSNGTMYCLSLYQADAPNQELLRKASDLPVLAPDWRDHFRKRLWNADG